MTTIVSYGAGTNSTAMLVGLHERGERPDLILFADTGGERPSTYAHLEIVNQWCKSVGFPEIISVSKGGTPETLESNCLRCNMLPSIAYGFKGCSHKYKKEPQEQFANNNNECKSVWKSGEKIVKLLGFDADESRRAGIPEDKKYIYRYPLIEWWWGREDCIEAIERAGLPQPGKSACFFCPSSKPREILALKREHPDLLARALAMEANAKLTTVKGLGRNFSWADLIAYDESQIDMFGFTQEMPCDCYDGE